MAEISKIKLTQINKAEYNPRVITEDAKKKLENSIKNFGLVEPIVINLKNNTIISGHQRYDILTDMELTDGNLAEQEYTLVKYGDLGLVLTEDEPTLKDEDWEKALNITLNNTNLTGDYDFEKLGSLLEDLSLSELDVSLTGFDDFELSYYSNNENLGFQELFDEDIDWGDEETPDDYVDIEGERPNENYVVSIAFNSLENANKFLKYIGAPNELKNGYNCAVHESNIFNEWKDYEI